MQFFRSIICLMAVCFISASLNAQYEVEIAFPSLSFTQPVDLQNAGDGSDRLFVVNRFGIIHVFENDENTTSISSFLDIQNRVDHSFGEEGLLGLAFHPDYENNGYFYVNYTGSGPSRSIISRFKVSPNNPNLAMADSEFVIIELPKPFANHNAGALAFGPDDGYLYITTGDGGSGGDPLNSGQDRESLLGKILRIDVDNFTDSTNYSIPADNPYADSTNSFRKEIYAYGLRNPWRMSFDPETGLLWAGDVGQDDYEEIDIIVNGGNYGWKIMEGNHCYSPSSNCNMSGLILPIWEYEHPSFGSASVTGGFVYRGSSAPGLTGKYIYADYLSGQIWALNYTNEPVLNEEIINSNLFISTFGVDESQELYFCAFNGRIYRFVDTSVGIEDAQPLASPETFELAQNYPNPFNPSTIIPFRVSQAADVRIDIFDLNGRWINTLLNQSMAAGQHEILWRGQNSSGEQAAAGIYFYRLQVDGRLLAAKRMVLLK